MTGHSPRCHPTAACAYCNAQPVPGCSSCGGVPTTVVSLYAGRRCDACPPVYDPHIAVRLLMAGWFGTAQAYVRSWSEPERKLA